ncbi:hypothetical protein D3C75_356750 [compost metagenome]
MRKDTLWRKDCYSGRLVERLHHALDFTKRAFELELLILKLILLGMQLLILHHQLFLFILDAVRHIEECLVETSDLILLMQLAK